MGRLYDNCQERNRCIVPEGNTSDLINDSDESVDTMIKELNYTVELFTYRVKYIVEKLKNSTIGLVG